MESRTQIDTVGFRVDFSDSFLQRAELRAILDYMYSIEGVYVDSVDKHFPNGMMTVEHVVYFNSTILTKINSGSFPHGEGRVYTMYYISMEFAGLKGYDEYLDQFRLDFLFSVASYFHDRQMQFRFTKLDVAVDIDGYYENMLILPIKSVGNVIYYQPDEEQVFSTTCYIEKKNKPKQSTSRGYSYDKQFKDDTDEVISRFELKFQNKFFNSREPNLTILSDAITKFLDRYAILYVEDEILRQRLWELHHKIQSLPKDVNKPQEYKKLRLERIRHYPDINYIMDFMSNLLNIKNYDGMKKKDVTEYQDDDYTMTEEQYKEYINELFFSDKGNSSIY
jgi:hypothetical protein